MNTLATVYKPSLGLLADLYQLTMAYGYWKTGKDALEAAFHLFSGRTLSRRFYRCRRPGHCNNFLEDLHFEPSDLDYLAALRGNDEKPLFDRAFLDYLAGMRLICDVDAMPEGTTVFPYEPLMRVRGPLIQAQLLEAAC